MRMWCKGNVTGKCLVSNASLVWAAVHPWTGQLGLSQACAEAAWHWLTFSVKQAGA